MVVLVVSLVKLVEVLWVIVAGMTIASVGVAVVVNDGIVGIVLPLELLVVSGIAVSELIRGLIDIVHEVHMLLIDWVVINREGTWMMEPA